MNIYAEDLKNKIKDFIESKGIELYDFQVIPLKKRTLVKVFIDKDNGITIEDCANVSRELDEIFFADNTFESSFILEVSSPGLDRPLTEEKHFIKNQGRKLKISYQKEGKTYYDTVRLKAVTAEGIEVDPEKKKRESFFIHFTEIEKAKIIPEFR